MAEPTAIAVPVAGGAKFKKPVRRVVVADNPSAWFADRRERRTQRLIRHMKNALNSRLDFLKAERDAIAMRPVFSDDGKVRRALEVRRMDAAIRALAPSCPRAEQPDDTTADEFKKLRI